MKISNQNKAVFMGASLWGKQEMDVKEKIAMKNQLYHKEAMHIVAFARKGDKRIDESVEKIRERVRILQEENEEANGFLTDIKAKMAQVKVDYNVADDSIEQQDLELMQKAYEAKKPTSGIELTDEEKERLYRMGEPTEYQKLSMELYEQADYWKEGMAKNRLEMSANTSVIRDVKRERLKSQAMVNAEKTKEELLEVASKEAISVLTEDVQEKMEEKAEEVKEAAEKKQEKKEEQAVKNEDIKKDINAEIKKILEEEKLLEEDLKGLAVDTTLR